MIPEHWFSTVANHLWQSTVFAGVAGLLALALRKNQAWIRSRLWMIASVKFLIPFSLLVKIGEQFQWPAAAPIVAPMLSAAMEQISRPFPQAPPVPMVVAHNDSAVPMILLAIWICGFVAVTFHWWRRWKRVRMAASAASPLDLGVGVPVLSSASLNEPGIFGVFRPVLLLPEGIAGRLAPAQFQAIVTHELCHVRRRDNLTAAIHMAVEAIFWFHPLVWWIGARLVEERERACDEEVLRLGSDPEIYAESILKICRLYLESPVVCVSGISGSDLKQRIRRIMTEGFASQLSLSRKVLLIAAGIAAVGGPIAFGLLNAYQSQAQSVAQGAPFVFEVASVKPAKSDSPGMFVRSDPTGRFSATNIPVAFLIQFAYRLKESQLAGGPSWINSEKYDIEAKPDEAVVAELQKAKQERRFEMIMPMLQSLLAERFKLAVHHETKELPLYVLVVTKNGSKMHESAQATADLPPPGPPGSTPHGFMRMEGRGLLEADSIAIEQFVDHLSHVVGRVVVDNTGLKGSYSFKLQWTPGDEDQMLKGMGPGPDGRPAPPPDAPGPTLFTALQEQLGLKLESQKGSVDTLVIDHVEKPSGN